MSIRIIDGFYLGAPYPIDSRFVVSNSTERNTIEHKYDGLKVFQLSDRTTYIWNDGLSSWDIDGSLMGGTGITNSISFWSSTSGLSSSNIYTVSNKIGINANDPKSILQLNYNSSEPLSLNIRSSAGNDISTLGYNWYYESSDQRFNSSKMSSKIEMGSNFGLSFQIRATSSSIWSPYLEIGNTSGFNILRSFNKGNFISGSSSFGFGTNPYISNQLLFVDGSFKMNGSLYEKTSTLTFGGLSIIKQSGFTQSFSTPTTTTTIGSTYYVDDNDSNLIVYNGSSSPMTIQIPSLPLTCDQIGRVLFINYKSNNSQFLNISVNGSTSLVSNFGLTVSNIQLINGESIKIVASYDSSNTPVWKVTQFANALSGSAGITASNGDFFYYTTSWGSTNFESKLRSVLGGLSSTPNEFLIKVSGGVNKSYIMFPQSSPTTIYNSTKSEIRLSGASQLGESKLTMTHFPSLTASGYSVVSSEGYQTGSGQILYVQSSNNSLVSTDERIKIQTKLLDSSIVGNSDPISQNGSIQIASKSSIDFISQTGEYYLGNRLHTSASTAVLPSVDDTLDYMLTLNTTSGKINRTLFGYYTDISSSTTFGSGISGTKTVRKYKDGTVVVSVYYTGSSVTLGIYDTVLSGLPAAFGITIVRARHGLNSLQPNTMNHADFSVSGTSIRNGISSISFGYLEFVAIYKTS